MRLSNRCLARTAAVLAAGCLFCHWAPAANAGFLSQGWSGFFDGLADFPTSFQPSPAGDGTVNFAVYQTVDTDWTNDFGTGFQTALRALLGTIDKTAKFVYFYQVVNNDMAKVDGTTLPASSTLRTFADSSLNEVVIPTLAQNAGQVLGYVFNDSTTASATAVGPSGNTYLGPNPAGGPGPVANSTTGLNTAKTVLSDVSQNGLPTNSVGGLSATTPFVSSANAINASGATAVPIGWVSDPLVANSISSGIAFHWLSTAATPVDLLTTGKYSSLVFFTSNDPFQFLTSRIDGVTGQAFNELPSTIGVEPSLDSSSLPEPSSFVVLAGLFSMGLFRRQRTGDETA